MLEFEIIDAGCIEGTSIHFLKGHLREGVLEDSFDGEIKIGESTHKIRVIGKSLLPIQTNPHLTGYVLKIEPINDVDYSALIGSQMLSPRGKA